MNSSASAPSRTTSIRLAMLFFFRAWSASLTSLGLSSTSRISMGLSVIVFFSFDRKIEHRAFVHFSLHPYAPAVALDDALYDGQTHARALVLFRAVKSLEHAEKFVHVFHVKAHAVVAHKVNLFLCGLLISDFNPGWFACSGVLDCVG